VTCFDFLRYELSDVILPGGRPVEDRLLILGDGDDDNGLDFDRDDNDDVNIIVVGDGVVNDDALRFGTPLPSTPNGDDDHDDNDGDGDGDDVVDAGDSLMTVVTTKRLAGD
jgi:hypothetical protein